MKHISEMNQAIRRERNERILGIIAGLAFFTSPVWGKVLCALFLGWPISAIVW